MFICDQEVKDYLENWANSENRTVSNLVETIVTETIAARKAHDPSGSSTSKGKGGKGGEE
jgi:hypothetical protein